MSMQRRQFLKFLATTGGGLIVGIPTTGGAATVTAESVAQSNFQPNVFLQITPANEVHFYQPHSEMGQGVHSGLTTLIAEELELNPESIQVHHAHADKAFANPIFGSQATGGSTSMAARFYQLREAAATARELLLSAAASHLKAPRDGLQMGQGYISWQGKNHSYGEFASLASTLPLPEQLNLKPPSEFKFIGQDRPRLDGLAKATGQAKFGIDVDFPGLYRAALVRCPVYGGTVKAFKAEPVLAQPGVKTVVEIFNGVAVVAESYWQAKQAAKALEVEWDLPALAEQSTETITQAFTDSLDKEQGSQGFIAGDGAEALALADKVIEAEYSAPYLAHTPMETPNCTVEIKGDHCEVWVGSQSPGAVEGIASFFGGVSKENVTVNSLFLGGGFGRRSGTDFVAEAVSIAKASGLAIQLVWSREDDIRHGYHRPASQVRFRAGLNEAGKITSWAVKRAGANIMPYLFDEMIDAVAPEMLPNRMVDWLSKRTYGIYDSWVVDESSIEGLFEDYDIPHKEVHSVTVDPGVPVWFWRSVGHSSNGFFKESFLDELAVATGQDAVAMRLDYANNDPKLQQVIRTAAAQARWGKPLPNNHFHGVAAHSSFNGKVAEVAEVSVENNRIKVHKVTCVINCGLAVNPDNIKAQMESSIIMGMTAAFYGDLTVADGAIQQSNFHDYQMLRMHEAPEIDVHIIDSNEDPSGVGEPGLPPVAAAIANAVYAATGQRLRQLPLKLS